MGPFHQGIYQPVGLTLTDAQQTELSFWGAGEGGTIPVRLQATPLGGKYRIRDWRPNLATVNRIFFY